MKRAIVISILFFVPILLLLAAWTTRPATSAPADQEINGVGAAWYQPDWHYRVPVTVTATTAQTDYPVRITLNNQFDFAHAQGNGADLRVTTSDGTTDLSFFVERWDNIGLSATIWVRIPSLSAGTTILYLYYGNATAPSASNGRMTLTAFEDFESMAIAATPTGFSNLTTGEWTRYAGNPVLQGTSGQWDATGATYGSVIYDTVYTQTFRMYYHGWGASSPCTAGCIGLATSPDGQTWTKYGTAPILTPGGAGAWDVTAVEVPMVWKEGPGDYRMMYTGNSGGVLQVGYATSVDGITWTKYAGNPVFNDSNAWAHNSTMNWGVIKVGVNYLMWYGDLNAPREASIATSTDLINWTPNSTTPIFTTSGVTTDDRYSQFTLFTFQYKGYYYVLVPSYTSVDDYARYYLYRSSSPYFPVNDRVMVRVVHRVGPAGAWDAQDSATPAVLTLDIQRSQFYNNQMWLYYSGANAGGTWREGLRIEPNIDTALYGAPTGTWGNLSWSNIVGASVVSTPVYQGVRSLQLHDTGGGSTTSRGTFAQVTRGVAGAWVRRTSAGTGGTDLYIYGNGPTDGLGAVVGLGGTSRQFHYWDRGGFHDVVTGPITQWSVNTWYYVTAVFNLATNTYDFVAYDTNMTEVVRVNGITMWRAGTAGTYVNSTMMYTDGAAYIGDAFWDNYTMRRFVSPEPAAVVRSKSDIQERLPVSGTGALPLTLTGAGINIATQGSLGYIQVIRYPQPHPNAPAAQQTRVKRYWEIIPNWNSSGYTASLTLPHPYVPDAGDNVCFYVSGTTWDCAANSFDTVAGTITRDGITQFSEWTTQEDFDPLAVTLKNFSAASTIRLLIPGLFAVGLVFGCAAAGLLWFSRKRTLHE